MSPTTAQAILTCPTTAQAILTYLVIWVIVAAGIAMMIFVAKRMEETDETPDVDDLDADVPDIMLLGHPDSADELLHDTARDRTTRLSDWHVVYVPIQSDDAARAYRAVVQGGVDDAGRGGGPVR